MTTKPTAAPARASTLIAATLVVAVAGPALAQDGERPGPRNFFAIGAAAGPDFIGSQDYGAAPFLAGRYDAGFAVFSTRGLGVEVDLLGPRTGGVISAGPIARYRFGRSDAENDVVDRLPNVDDAVEIGGFASYAFTGLMRPGDALSFRIEAADVVGGHDGVLFTPSIGYRAPITRRLAVTIGASLDFGDDDFADATFGVDAAGAAASGLAQFDAEGGAYRAGVSVGATYALSPTWGLTGVANYGRLLGDAADSPIVEDEGSADQFFGGLGLVYSV